MSETKQLTATERAALLKLHEYDELVFGGFYCMHCTPDDEYSLDDPIAWPCKPLSEAGVTDEEAVELIQAHREQVAAKYQAELEADKAEGQRQADEFNRRFPIGTPVVAYPGIRPEHPVAVAYQKRVAEGRTFASIKDPCKRLDTATRTPAWTLGHGTPVVSVEGYAGGIHLDHIDVAPRTNTPDEKTVNDEGRTVTTVKLKRACNGCGQYLGDADNRDVDANGNLTDVRHECPNCQPLVELEAAGCRTWELTPRSFSTVAHQIDQLKPWVFTKSYWQTVDGKLQVVGLRIGQYPNHLVAYFGDWIIRHPDGQWSVHKAPVQDEAVTR